MKTIIFTSVLLFCVIILSVTSCTKSNTNPPAPAEEYSVFAWNDLGIHCLNPTYDKLVILPPYNNIFAQVVKKGNPPEVVSSGITVSYKLLNNTSSYGKRAYGGFWDNSMKLFGTALVQNIGLKGNGLSGEMAGSGIYYVAEGVFCAC